MPQEIHMYTLRATMAQWLNDCSVKKKSTFKLTSIVFAHLMANISPSHSCSRPKYCLLDRSGDQVRHCLHYNFRYYIFLHSLELRNQRNTATCRTLMQQKHLTDYSWSLSSRCLLTQTSCFPSETHSLCHEHLIVPSQSSVMVLSDDVVIWSIRAIPAWDIYGPASLGGLLTTPTLFNLTAVIPCHCLMAVAMAYCQSTQRHWVFVCVPQSVNVQTDIQHHGMAGQSAVCQSNVGQSNM